MTGALAHIGHQSIGSCAGSICEHLTLASVGIFFFREALEGEEVIIDVALVGISNSFSFSGVN